MTIIYADEIKTRLRAAIEKKGGITKFAASRDMTEGYVHRVLRSGKPGKRLATFLKLKEIRGHWEEIK